MQKLNINTHMWGYDVSEIEHETVTKSDHSMYSKFTYPNGFVLETEMHPDGTVNVKCNKPLRREADGSYTPIID
ncbi:TPA: hypothetical protein ACJ7D8_000469 [Streptococcus pyogenes]|uniref:Uncharacterized protein n=1 Tax=Streptococcus dysgalactiae subsp. equisimilis TaxID=119602 RepID=A0A9X8SY31_STREQ|nr:hypothetical protein [Streptococcus pyogenes]QBX28774.1 hypothetical protein Javan464_0059 [Streptococcus phage Javan464]SQF66306.1 Uncharacterised protein [Streptococcus dysgalactiae subsp. equisimilis]VEF04384.1 Uncharacterised protein [Streptococcus dysgalactiae subsp. equisimilis]VGU01586.1 Uncharacterised protein [Streptococcus pyogenes]VHE56543.1 Uncharacterised protein [Streptococcus pyogenes]